MARPVVDTPTTMTPIPPPILLKVQSRPPETLPAVVPPARVITTGQPSVRPANEALQILETHRNQTKDETNDLKQNQNKTTTNANPQAIVIKIKQDPPPPPTKPIQTLENSPKSNGIMIKTPPKVRSAGEALKILENYRKNKQRSIPNVTTDRKSVV